MNKLVLFENNERMMELLHRYIESGDFEQINLLCGPIQSALKKYKKEIVYFIPCPPEDVDWRGYDPVEEVLKVSGICYQKYGGEREGIVLAIYLKDLEELEGNWLRIGLVN